MRDIIDDYFNQANNKGFVDEKTSAEMAKICDEFYITDQFYLLKKIAGYMRKSEHGKLTLGEQVNSASVLFFLKGVEDLLNYPETVVKQHDQYLKAKHEQEEIDRENAESEKDIANNEGITYNNSNSLA